MPILSTRNDSVVLKYNGATLVINAKITLAHRTDKPTSLTASFRDTADRWTVALSCVTEGRAPSDVQTHDYYTGTGHRKWPASLGPRPRPGTVYEMENSQPVAPALRDFLISWGSDIETGLGMPAPTAEALDYLCDELGFDGKRPSEVYRTMEALRKALHDASLLLRGTGMSVETFAMLCRELDA